MCEIVAQALWCSCTVVVVVVAVGVVEVGHIACVELACDIGGVDKWIWFVLSNLLGAYVRPSLVLLCEPCARWQFGRAQTTLRSLRS